MTINETPRRKQRGISGSYHFIRRERRGIRPGEIKFMLSSVIVGMVGIYLLNDLDLAKLSIKGTILGPVILGALIFGRGWGLLGYCPGTPRGRSWRRAMGRAVGDSRHDRGCPAVLQMAGEKGL